MNEHIEFDQLFTPLISYCLDANYYKGTTVEQYIRKKRRQLVMSDYRIRKLTPKECWRLQGFSDESFERAREALNNKFYKGKDKSSSQLYKQAGNSIVTDVLFYIFLELYKAMPYLFDELKVSSYFSGIGAFEIALDRLFDSINSNSICTNSNV